MRRPVLRALMAVVGVATLAVYFGVAYLAYLLVATVWQLRPSLWLVALYLVGLTLLFTYVSYQVGTARILQQLRVRSLAPEQAPGFHRRIAALAEEMEVAHPEVLVAAMEHPNALALGGAVGRGTVVLDRHLFRLLTADELVAIVAHELAHIERRDSVVQTLGYSVLRTLSGVVFLLLAPLLLLATGLARGLAWIGGRPETWAETLPGKVGRLIGGGVAVVFFALTLALLAHSRRREFAADDRAAAVTGDPLALARALRKIERASGSPLDLLTPLYTTGEDEQRLLRWLSTHPETDERVERLRERAAESRAGRRIPVQ